MRGKFVGDLRGHCKPSLLQYRKAGTSAVLPAPPPPLNFLFPFSSAHPYLVSRSTNLSLITVNFIVRGSHDKGRDRDEVWFTREVSPLRLICLNTQIPASGAVWHCCAFKRKNFTGGSESPG